MKTPRKFPLVAPVWLALCSILNILPSLASAQGTAFTYQGNLNDNGAPANGSYDLRFSVFDSTNCPGTLIAGPLTNDAVTVNNGLFVAQLDFGPGVFTGPDRWLEIGVRTNGGSGFTELTPRQPLSATPYSIFAGAASNLVGTLPASQLSGTLPAAQLPPNVATTNFVVNNFALNFPTNLLCTNMTAGVSNYIVNTEVPDGTVIVCPYSNLPASITNNPYYFGPWKGADYVQQAIDSCAEFPNRIAGVGGGKILVVGINYCPAPLNFVNALQNAGSGNVTSFDVEAPAFTAGALVCLVNPCIQIAPANGGVYDSTLTFTMKNLIISSLQDTPTNLFELYVGAARVYLGYNWFGYWGTLTNHQSTYGLAGLITPAVNTGIAQHNLTVEIWGAGDDLFTVENNSFLGIQGVYFNPDHGTFRDNFFSYCGGPSAWTNSAWTAGATVLIGDAFNADRVFEHNYFYACPYTYMTDQGGDLDWLTELAPGRDIAIGDANIEGTYNTIRIDGGYILQFGGGGMLLDSPSFAATMSGGDLGDPPSLLPNAVVTVGGTTSDYRFSMDSDGLTLSGGSFNGNGSGLTGLNASSITTGALPSGQLSGSYSSAVSLSNPANNFTGSFSGNGSGLTFTNAAGAAFSLMVNAATNGFILVPQ